MNIEQALLKEHSKKQISRIVKYIGNNPVRFRELMHLFVRGEYRITQRAAWPLSYCVQAYPKLIIPHLGKMVTLFYRDDLHDAVTRNIARLLRFVDLPVRYHGRVMARCFQLLQSQQTPVATRVFCMYVLQKMTKIYPDIAAELRMVVQDNLHAQSAAFKAAARNVLN
jgi:hypothetical protein